MLAQENFLIHDDANFFVHSGAGILYAMDPSSFEAMSLDCSGRDIVRKFKRFESWVVLLIGYSIHSRERK